MSANITQVAAISVWNDSYGSMGPGGHVRDLARFGDGGRAKSSMDPRRWLEVVLFGRKSPCRKGDSVATFGIHSHPSDCNFRLWQFVGIIGTMGTR